MEVYNDCLPCLLRGALNAAKIATEKKDMQTRIMKETLQLLAGIDPRRPPPLIARQIQKNIRDLTGNTDPYKRLKQQYNAFAQSIYDDLARTVETSPAPFETAVRLAIAGNIIDFGTAASIGEQRVFDTIEKSLKTAVKGDISLFESKAAEADNILWLADNAGEILFDRLLLEILGTERITFAVRGGPVLNDATVEDAVETGIADLVRVIDNGSDIPGTCLKMCSDLFRETYETADLIVSKGQGNYETLPGEDKRIVFLFKVKCPVVAEDTGFVEGDACCLSFHGK